MSATGLDITIACHDHDTKDQILDLLSGLSTSDLKGPSDADGLLHLLTHGYPQRDVYEGRDGRWYVTYGGGEVDLESVLTLVRAGKINSKYSDVPRGMYYVGRTIDVPRTMEARRKHGKNANIVHVGDPADLQ